MIIGKSTIIPHVIKLAGIVGEVGAITSGILGLHLVFATHTVREESSSTVFASGQVGLQITGRLSVRPG